MPTDQLLACDLVQQAGGRLSDLQLLVGELGYVEQFFAIRPVDDITIRTFEAVERAADPNAKLSYVDSEAYFGAEMRRWSWWGSALKFSISPGDLPPSMLEISELPKIFQTDDATVRLGGHLCLSKGAVSVVVWPPVSNGGSGGC